MKAGLRTLLKITGGVGAIGFAATLAAFVWLSATWDRALASPDTAAPPLSSSQDPAAIARGRYLVHGPAHCSSCHSTDDRAHPEGVATAPLRGGLAFDLGPLGATYARNLTPDLRTGIGRRTDAELARTLRTSVLPEGSLSIFMRFSAARLSDNDISDVLSYLRSIEPVAHEVPPLHLTWIGKPMVRLMFSSIEPLPLESPLGVPASAEPTVERGRYLAENVMLCTSCHTAYDPATYEPVGPKAGGGTVEPTHGADAGMEYAPPNLTPHPTGQTGQLSEDAFLARIRAGRVYTTSVMPWENFQVTDEADLRSVYRYLRTLPPVDADTGPGYRKAGWRAEEAGG